MSNAHANSADLKEELTALQAKFSATESPAPAAWKLTAHEERVFSVLLAVDTATRDAVGVALARAPTRTVDVFVSRIRKKISPHGLEIETVRGKGWRLVSREAWRHALAAQHSKGV